ncbi:MAG TPA: hypothetical protein VHV82_21865 [Sporichthyaceae bacterium]|jgi:uncharacterized delta-60 repeat protein|nr:hypothetical protein [Sporichthyaceae bacterium]
MSVRLGTGTAWGRRGRRGRLGTGTVVASAALLATTSVAAAASGALDSTFGAAHNGTVLTALGQNPLVATAARQADGKIVIAGSTTDGTVRKFALVRFNPDGTLDSTFGSGGSVLTAVGDSNTSVVGALAVQGDGKIIAVGTAGDHGQTDFAMARYTTAGALDPAFGAGGVTLTKFGTNSAAADAIAVQADGKIVVGGAAGTSFALARYSPVGLLDPGFGAGGALTTSFGSTGPSNVSATLLQPDGKLVAAGVAAGSGGVSSFALARYTPAGVLDPSFGTGGQKLTVAGSAQKATLTSATLLPDGRLVATGVVSDAGKYKFGLAGYTAQGSPDPSFGTNGLVLSSIGDGGLAAPAALLRAADGKLLVVGTVVDGGNRKFAVVRYLPNGSPDTGFGTAGVITTVIGDGGFATSGLLTPDGKIVLAGSAQDGTALKLALARYNLG